MTTPVTLESFIFWLETVGGASAHVDVGSANAVIKLSSPSGNFAFVAGVIPHEILSRHTVNFLERRLSLAFPYDGKWR